MAKRGVSVSVWNSFDSLSALGTVFGSTLLLTATATITANRSGVCYRLSAILETLRYFLFASVLCCNLQKTRSSRKYYPDVLLSAKSHITTISLGIQRSTSFQFAYFKQFFLGNFLSFFIAGCLPSSLVTASEFYCLCSNHKVMWRRSS